MKCFYHHDVDGRSSAYLVYMNHKDELRKEDMFEVDYVKDLPYDLIEKDEVVYFVDYSFTKSTVHRLEKLLKITKNIIWLDHHQSSVDLLRDECSMGILDDLHHVTVANEKISGVMVTWLYFNSYKTREEAPEWVKLISDYDCWVLSNQDAQYFKLYLDTVDQHPMSDIWNFISIMSDTVRQECINIGMKIYEYIKVQNKWKCDNHGFECKIEGLDYKIFALNEKGNSLLFGDKIDEYDIVISFVYNGFDYIYSLFTNKPYVDCKAIAESFRGGGHKQAAGCTTQNLILSTTRCIICENLIDENDIKFRIGLPNKKDGYICSYCGQDKNYNHDYYMNKLNK